MKTILPACPASSRALERAGGVRFANGEQGIDLIAIFAQHLLGLVEGRLRRVDAVLIGRENLQLRDIWPDP